MSKVEGKVNVEKRGLVKNNSWRKMNLNWKLQCCIDLQVFFHFGTLFFQWNLNTEIQCRARGTEPSSHPLHFPYSSPVFPLPSRFTIGESWASIKSKLRKRRKAALGVENSMSKAEWTGMIEMFRTSPMKAFRQRNLPEVDSIGLRGHMDDSQIEEWCDRNEHLRILTWQLYADGLQ